MGGFLASVSQYWISYHVTILFGVLLICECLFLPETHYPRAVVLEHEAECEGQEISMDTKYNAISDIKRTKSLGYLVRIVTPWNVLLSDENSI